MSDDAILTSLSAAVDAAPTDDALRLHLAELLLDRGRRDEVITHVAAVLSRTPGHPEAAALMGRALGTTPAAEAAVDADPDAGPPQDFDWAAAESEVSDVVGPRFTDEGREPAPAGDHPGPDARPGRYAVEASGVRLADVGGMDAVKDRLDVAFLAPLRNEKLRALYGKSLRGGLLLYGPPGCGKTFLARAVAGELGAGFLSVGIHDVLDMWIGSSEQNMHEVFRTARAHAPCVLFFDELDGIAQKRSAQVSGATRSVVNQMLTELDGMVADNDGVFVLGATNTPWDVDAALRRPGRFDRAALVLPPDEPARRAILTYHLRERPVENVALDRLVARTDGFSGADLAHVCESASEQALRDSVRSGDVRMIAQRDLEGAVGEIRPSTGPWFATARQVALYANADGEYDELVAYMKRRKML